MVQVQNLRCEVADREISVHKFSGDSSSLALPTEVKIN
jgi:hypothetical protein